MNALRFLGITVSIALGNPLLTAALVLSVSGLIHLDALFSCAPAVELPADIEGKANGAVEQTPLGVCRRPLRVIREVAFSGLRTFNHPLRIACRNHIQNISNYQQYADSPESLVELPSVESVMGRHSGPRGQRPREIPQGPLVEHWGNNLTVGSGCMMPICPIPRTYEICERVGHSTKSYDVRKSAVVGLYAVISVEIHTHTFLSQISAPHLPKNERVSLWSRACMLSQNLQ